MRAEAARSSGSQGYDPAHDVLHFERVVATARKLAAQEQGARWEVIAPAAWLHDLVNVPKNDPRRSQASRLSADQAIAWLRGEGYPHPLWEEIHHAIAAHSYSAGIEARSLEARIVQDADRLDGLGAIGVARLFSVSGLLARPLYSGEDPFAEKRELDDLTFGVDHFYKKLFRTVETLRTESGRAEGERRAKFMRGYLEQLGKEIGVGSGK